MNTYHKWILYGFIILAIFLSLTGCYYLRKLALIGTAYKAKVLCSCVFVSGRDPESILNQDLGADDLALLKCFNAEIDYDEQSVSATCLGFAKRKAIFRKGLGCTLVIDSSEKQIRSQINPHKKLVLPSFSKKERLWPMGERVLTEKLPPEINSVLLDNAIDSAFSEPDPNRLRRTRAVVVVYDGRIIAERYAEGFSHETPLIGWSMTKSVMNALIGILVDQGKLSLEDNALLPEWRESNDPRSDITLNQLLHMTSGLKFNEDYTNPLEDLIFMLLGTGDVAAYAAKKSLETKPGSEWHYSSGTTNIISRIIRDSLDEVDTEYPTFPHQALFDPIGMRSAIIEPDAAGTFIGSSFMYATARDWARFGLLYLQDGIWEGKRILPEGWVGYTIKPASQDSLDDYGAHFWLKVPSPYKGSASVTRSLPSDTYHAVGHEGQFITVIPSRKLVVVRLGLSRLSGAWDHESFITGILEAIPYPLS